MYIGPVTVGRKMDSMKKKFSEALASGSYEASENKLLSDAINSVEYIKGFFAGTSVLPTLEEEADTTWGMTFDWLRGSFKKIDEAESLLEEGLANELQLTNGMENAQEEDKNCKDFGQDEADENEDAMWYVLSM